jgi:outer membrane protein assembly factor BamE (lipoprotein component of BamABCDE complex)
MPNTTCEKPRVAIAPKTPSAARGEARRFVRLGGAVLATFAALAAGCASVPGGQAPIDVAVAQRVAPGQSRDQVRSTLGAPASTTSFATLGEEVWAYKMVDASQAKPRRNFYVYFDDRSGAVRRTEALSDGDYDTGCGTGR